jgi:general nucleoside transport system ATP-binding protein
LREVLEIADRITVIRRGQVVGTTSPQETNRETLAEMMVGREVSLEVDKEHAEPGDVVLSVEELFVLDERNQVAVDGVSFQVHSGEVLGIAGVQGNGQTELVEALTGLRDKQDGRVSLFDQDITQATPRQVTEMGVAHIPEDRQRDGLVLAFPVADNLVLNTFYKHPFSKRMVLQNEVILETASQLVDEFDIRTPSVVTTVGSLSGGNQQKVIVAREFSRPIKLLVASQPTRGLDVGSVEYIHRRIVEKRDEGCAVLLVSSELDEIMELSDRIAVMYRGKIVDILAEKAATKEAVGLLMAGIQPETTTQAQEVI